MEEAAVGWRRRRFRGRRRGGGHRQRGAGRCSVPADRPAESRKRFFGAKARQMSRAQRRALVEREDPALPVLQQCRLLAVSRASVYRRLAEGSDEDRAIMALIDRQHLARLYYASRRMASWLATQGPPINRKRVQRLMRLIGLVAVYQRPNTSKPAAAQKVYPYLLGGLSIDRVNQVWCSDITYIPMAKGFLYLVAIMDWHSRAVLPGGCRTRSAPISASRPWRTPWHGTASPRSSTPIKAASSLAPSSPACSSIAASQSAWMARTAAWTTSLSSGCGGA